MKYVSMSEKGLGIRLRNLGFKNYREYLLSDHWILLRNRFFSESKVVKKMFDQYGFLVCHFCKNGKTILHLHHQTYKRLGREGLKDLFLICEKCHTEIHSMSRDKNLYERTKLVRRKFKSKVK